jgi:hypothetical protein
MEVRFKNFVTLRVLLLNKAYPTISLSAFQADQIWCDGTFNVYGIPENYFSPNFSCPVMKRVGNRIRIWIGKAFSVSVPRNDWYDRQGYVWRKKIQPN